MNARDQFVRAMLALLNRYSIENITVEMIVQQGNSSKSSFYRLFLDKYQLMTLSYADYIAKILDRDFAHMDWAAVQEKILRFMLENRRAFENMFKIKGQDSFVKFLYAYKLGYVKEAFIKRKGVIAPTNFESFVLEMYAAAMVHSERQWVKRGMDLPPEELTDIMIAAMPDILRGVLLDPPV